MRNMTLATTLFAIAACGGPVNTVPVIPTPATATKTSTVAGTSVQTTVQNTTVTVTTVLTKTETVTVTVTAANTATDTNTTTATTINADATAPNDTRPVILADAGAQAKSDAAADAPIASPLTIVSVTCGDPSKLSAGVSLPCEAIGNAGSIVSWCSFFVNGTFVKTVTTAQFDGSFLAEVVLKAGANVVQVRCADTGNATVSGEISVNALTSDSGVTVGSDAQLPPDAMAATDVGTHQDVTPVVLVDGGTDSLVAAPDARPFIGVDSGAIDSLGSSDAEVLCQGYARGVLFIATEGQATDCTYNGMSGKQQCLSGKMTPCTIPTNAIPSPEHVFMDCVAGGTGNEMIAIAGNVIGDMIHADANATPVNVGANATPMNKLCLVGDQFGGWGTTQYPNHQYCIDYSPDASTVYLFDTSTMNVSLPAGDSRFTFVTYQKTEGAPDSEDYWDNNFVLHFAVTTDQRCRIKDANNNKLVFAGQ